MTSKWGSKIKGIFDNITFGLSLKQKSTPQHFWVHKNKAKDNNAPKMQKASSSIFVLYMCRMIIIAKLFYTHVLFVHLL